MDEPDRAKHEHLKREVVGIYDRAASIYDQVGIRQAAYFGRRLIDRLEVPSGARVLDVATGRGALLFAAAEKAGPSGHLAGIDLAPRMLSETAAEIRARGLGQAELVLMDADTLAFADRSFDCILCGYALHFLDYPRVLLRFHQLLKPGGKLATLHPYVPADDENLKRWQWLFDLTREVFPPGFVPPSAWVAPNRLNRPELIEAALRGAGFRGVSATGEEAQLYFADEEDWWAWEWSQGSRFWVEGMSPEGLARFKAVSFEKLAAMKDPAGIAMRTGALLVTAHS